MYCRGRQRQTVNKVLVSRLKKPKKKSIRYGTAHLTRVSTVSKKKIFTSFFYLRKSPLKHVKGRINLCLIKRKI